MTASKTTGYDAFGKVVIAVGLLVVAAIVNGLVLTRLWAWFVTGTFGIQGLSIAQAIGLAVTVRFLTSSAADPTKNDKTFGVLLAEGITRLVLINGFTLLLGLLVVQFT